MHSRYSDADKSAALAVLKANNGNVKRTAIQLGIPRKTLSGWASGRGVIAELPDLKSNVLVAFESNLKRQTSAHIDALTQTYSGASLDELARALCILIDKYEDLKGE